MQEELIKRAKELLADGTVARVLGWKAGDLPYNPEPAYFETEESLKDFVYNGFCGANLSKYMIEASKLEGKTLVEEIIEKPINPVIEHFNTSLDAFIKKNRQSIQDSRFKVITYRKSLCHYFDVLRFINKYFDNDKTSKIRVTVRYASSSVSEKGSEPFRWLVILLHKSAEFLLFFPCSAFRNCICHR